jgi:acetoin:2,6-dichlorophenolindophenol oxidoreductase subunit beta
VARVVELLGSAALDAVARHAVPDVPIPAARALEEAVIPRAETIAAAVRALAS